MRVYTLCPINIMCLCHMPIAVFIGRRSFPVAAATVWNTLPVHVQWSPSIPTFRQLLKTFLFQQSFPDIIIWHY